MRDMRTLVRRLAEQGMTVVLSSQLMSKVEELCNRVAIISRGRIIREGRLDELLRSAVGRYQLETTDLEQARVVCARLGVEELETGEAELRFRATAARVAELSIALGRAGIGITKLAPEAASLEELFLRLTEEPEPSAAQPTPAVVA
jgi:ABC-2 type transport system ATP-binding protein